MCPQDDTVTERRRRHGTKMPRLGTPSCCGRHWKVAAAGDRDRDSHRQPIARLPIFIDHDSIGSTTWITGRGWDPGRCGRTFKLQIRPEITQITKYFADIQAFEIVARRRFGLKSSSITYGLSGVPRFGASWHFSKLPDFECTSSLMISCANVLACRSRGSQ
jgi:hypothetical protein